MNVSWLLVGMHFLQKKLIRKIQNLLLNFEYFLLFRKMQHLLDTLAVSFYVNLWTEVPKSCQGFQKKTENINVCTFLYSLPSAGSKLSHLNQKRKDWTFRFQKKKYACLIMTGNASVENVPFSLNWLKFKIMS